jgi:hypothetical protein
MKRSVAVWAATLLLGIVLWGCDQPAHVAKTPTGPPPPPPAPLETQAGVYAGGLDDLAARPSAPAPAPPPPVQQPATEIVKAEAGVGAKGQSLANEQGLMVTPVKVFFLGPQKIFFEIEFKENYKTWEASAERTPKDFDELKAQFLDPLGLTKKLPVLPQGHKYVWDAEKKELGVERPVKR